MSKILVVDDEPELLNMIRRSFLLADYEVITAINGKEALNLIHLKPDVILLDVMMPDMDGFEVCKKIRDQIECPIIFLTAKSDIEDKVNGFSIGADDYVVKPFEMDELLARVEAHIRRDHRKNIKDELTFQNELTINYSHRVVTIGDQVLSLKTKEYDILEKLSLHPNQIFFREDLYISIWGGEKSGSNISVAEYISKIRMKIAQYSDHEYIRTIWRCGYIWNG